MIDPRRQSYRKYINYLKNAMHLKDWSFIIADDSPITAHSLAEIRLTYGRKLFVIMFSDAFLTETAKVRRHTLVHELIHAHLTLSCDFASEHLDSRLNSIYIRLTETAVDGIADAVSQFFELP